MNRVYFVHDPRGDRQLAEDALPLQLGGANAGDLEIPGLADDAVVGYIALAEGHPYLQPAEGALPLFHNHERVSGSRWLKSGDRVQIGDAAMLLWQVSGDQVFVTIERFTPPATRPSGRVTRASRTGGDLPDGAAMSIDAKRRVRRWPLLVGLAVLGLAALFVVFAVPVTVDIRPAPESYAIEGGFPGVPLAGRRLLLPGTYRVTAQRPGYVPISEEIEVSGSGPSSYRFVLNEQPGRLEVAVEPRVAFTLVVDGEPIEAGADGRFPVARGVHDLRIETARHLPIDTEIDVDGFGRVQPLGFSLDPAWAELHLASDPLGARVEVDGVAVGTTPLVVDLMRGTRTLELALPGHETVRLDLPVEAGTVLRPDAVVLPPARAVLELDSTPPGATVSVDGNFRGTAPLRLELESGRELRLRLALPGHRTVERTVTLEPAQVDALTVELPARLGTLFVSATPADAELFVDGRPAGGATRRLRLAAREHVLEFRRTGYASKKIRVTPNPAASQRIDVTLQTVAAAAEAAMPELLKAPGGLTLRLVRPGPPFRMGASRREAGRRANESVRRVALTRPFYLGSTEVTNAQYRRFASGHDPGSGEGVPLSGDERPVVRVDWNDAARFCNWLSREAGLPEAYAARGDAMLAVTPMNTGYRLPTEAEWAYVARAHGRESPARYPWDGGYPPASVVGNYADASIRDTLADTVPGYDDGYRATAPVGRYPAWPEGFFDLGGNVAEWMHDYYAIYPGVANEQVADPSGPSVGDHHVVRGASWRFGSITELRLSYRDYSRVGRDDLGFRVARYAR